MGIKFKSIRLEVFVLNITIVVISLITMATVQYFSEISLLEDHIVEKASVSMQPIVTVAAKSVEGGNLMTFTPVLLAIRLGTLLLKYGSIIMILIFS